MSLNEERTLLNKRKSVKGSLTRIQNFVNAFSDDQDSVELKIRNEKLAELWSDYKIIQSQLEELDFEKHESHREEFELHYYNLKSQIEKLLHTESNTTAHCINNSVNQKPKVQVPHVTIPQFSGNYQDWQSFHDIFVSVIHNNENITAVEKLVHLKTSLSGEALKVIEAIRVTSDNYSVAWKLLTERFNNKEFIINSHIEALFELPHVARDLQGGLRNIITDAKQRLSCLSSLGVPVASWDYIIIYLLKGKLDRATRQAWELSRRQDMQGVEAPKIDEFLSFLERRCFSYEAGVPHTSQDRVKNETKNKVSHVVSEQKSTFNCGLCKAKHSLWMCSKFLSQNQQQRVNSVKQLGVCFNCLRKNHTVNDCKAGSCQKCSKKHHTLIHFDRESHTEKVGPNEQAQQNVSKTQPAEAIEPQINLHNSTKHPEILLATAVIKILDTSKQWQPCRVLLDSASQVNFVAKSLLQRIGSKTSSRTMTVNGINQIQTNSNKVVNLRITNREGSYNTNLEFLVLDNITTNLPTKRIKWKHWQLPHGIALADPQFNVPSKIEMLLGAEIFLDILRNQQIKLGDGLPILQNTAFGWIISGKVSNNEPKHEVSCFLATEQLEHQICKFWEVEEFADKKILSQEEEDCEEHFVKNTTRDSSGRFIVKLPFKQNPAALGESFSMASRRLKYLENRLQRDENLKNQYQEFLQEFFNLGHMKFTSNSEQSNQQEGYFLPHHPVVKDTSLTTKVRVVFDASALTTSGYSLNNLLMIGPTIQDNLFSIILRFRTHKYVLTADIEKMYRQVKIHEDDTRYQKILWRNNPTEEMGIYELTTVTYGTACAPFLAVRCLFKLADDEKEHFPKASEIVKRDFYVDDVLTGSDSRENALELKRQLIELLNQGGFKLRKWLSNDPSLLSDIADKSVVPHLNLDPSQTIKTLGVHWNAQIDCIMYSINSEAEAVLTKRKLLSQIARLFDPLGLLGPVLVIAKLLMQDMWKLNISWDDPVSDSIKGLWIAFSSDLRAINQVSINRKALIDDPVEIEIHGFCDSSERAYGACLYVKSLDEARNSKVTLLCAKSRVAPLKRISLPRLELCSAVTLARLYQTVSKALPFKTNRVYLWSDSTVTLYWIKTPSHQLKTFIANRVAEIQKLTCINDWRHIMSTDNPADILSRGCLISKLITEDKWWYGPSWLKLEESLWPHGKISFDNLEGELELKPNTSSYTATTEFSLFQKYSTLTKLERVTAYCLRFLHNCKARNTHKLRGLLAVVEIKQALHTLIKKAQQEVFSSEIQRLSNHLPVESHSSLKSLHPFIDSNNLLRVGGRLQNSNLEFDSKHQIILPNKHHLTTLILKHEHEKLLHSGAQAVLNNIRSEYWPINGRNQIRKIIHNCHKCFRFQLSNKDQNQLMGNLPKYRVQPSRPFLNVGVDYGGPILLKSGNPRKPLITKSYIALFICMATKAIHLELVSSLSTEAFLSAFRRFTARRGKCINVYSDNGTNFQGAHNELKRLQAFLQTDNVHGDIATSLANDNIQWHFIPPMSPNFGGLWEAGIKTVKFHIKRVIGETKLNFEEMYTLLTQIEACVNSRPLTPIHNDPLDLAPLTPAHFLIGTPLVQVPDHNLTDIPTNRLKRWQLVQHMVQYFWKRWSHEYLHQLQQRAKWTTERANLNVGDMVLVKEDNTSPLNWKIARVVEIHAGKDDKVRVATIRTTSGTVKRGVTKLCPLPMETC